MPVLCVLLLGLLVACLDEGLQYVHPERVGDLRDVQLNAISIALGFILYESPFLSRQNIAETQEL